MNMSLRTEQYAFVRGHNPIAGLKVLIVEDEKILALDLESLLTDHGASEILLAGSVREARKILSQHADIAFVLLDLKLPDGCGTEVSAEIDAVGIPSVITTGYSDYVSDSTPVIYKPYSEDKLLMTILSQLL